MKMSEIGIVSKLVDFLRINEENELLEIIGNIFIDHFKIIEQKCS